ncbi:unnamed protein product [Rhodiola kirilowii]
MKLVTFLFAHFQLNWHTVKLKNSEKWALPLKMLSEAVQPGGSSDSNIHDFVLKIAPS